MKFSLLFWSVIRRAGGADAGVEFTVCVHHLRARGEEDLIVHCTLYYCTITMILYITKVKKLKTRTQKKAGRAAAVEPPRDLEHEDEKNIIYIYIYIIIIYLN